MKKSFYILLILGVLIAHTVMLNSWLSDKDFAPKRNGLSMERHNIPSLSDSISIASEKGIIRNAITDTELAKTPLREQNN